MSFNYGLTYNDLHYTRKKIENQREFLKINGFTTSSGDFKSLLDISYSSNHSERYYSQILNKVHTLDSYALSLDYVPIFMTATLDGCFHEMLHGNFSKFYRKYEVIFDEQKQKKIIKDKKTGRKLNLVPNNDRYGYILDDIVDKKALSVSQLYKILSFQMNGFQKSYVFKNIKKLGHEVSYLRVTEPMKSGVPHFHMLLYTNEQFIKPLYDSFHKYFNAPRNSAPLTHKENKRVCTKLLDDGTKETQGFQWDIRSATGYVLKYVLKTFRNVQNNEDIDYLQAWYIHNRIPRIITSHTLVPQWVYHKISPWYNDWFYFCYMKKYHSFTCDSDTNTFTFQDHDFNLTYDYDNGVLSVYHKDKLIKEVGSKKPSRKRINTIKLKFRDKKENHIKKPLIPVLIENIGKTLYIVEGLSKAKPKLYYKTVSQMTLLELIEHQKTFDPDFAPIARYYHVVNELRRRGYDEGEQIPLSYDNPFDDPFKEEHFHEFYN